LNERRRFFSFAWWNLHNFAHYDRARISHPRWPRRRADAEAKRDRILAALGEVFGTSYPDLIAVCEITQKAASDLGARLPGRYEILLPPLYPTGDGFHVAVFYRPQAGLAPEVPLLPGESEDVPEGTRPMMPVHLTLPGHLSRFVACHWTAYDNSSSRVVRERLADVLRRDSYNFLEPPSPTPGVSRHLVVLGDLNAEPMSRIFAERLIGCRDRASSRHRHWRDDKVRRIRLYNAAWRYLGEQVPHGPRGQPIGAAGTLYNDSQSMDKRGWRTYDHLLVSAGLLGEAAPHLDEAQTGIRFTPSMRDESGRPKPFAPVDPRGVSDHLPIVGRLVVPEATP
jgi:hypothetical protein